MTSQTIEDWTAQYRVEAAVRDFDDALVRVAGSGAELQKAVAGAGSISVLDEDAADMGMGTDL